MILKIDKAGLNMELTEGKIISIGRKGHNAEIELEDNLVSRNHASLMLDKGKVKIKDLNSKNGIIINGTKVQPDQWHTVNNIDKISILGYDLEFYNADVPLQVQPIVEQVENNKKQIDKTDLNATFLELIRLQKPFVIGRSLENDIVLPSETKIDKLVSRRHAEIFYDNGQYWVKDLDTADKTYLNGETLPPLLAKPFGNNDTVTIRNHSFHLVNGYRAVQVKPVYDKKDDKKVDKKEIPERPVLNVIVENEDNMDVDKTFRNLVREKKSFVIGRSKENGIVLPNETDRDKLVGRTHAEIYYEEGRYWVKDIKSKNLTYLNGEALKPMVPTPLNNNDTVIIHLHSFSLAEGYHDLRKEPAIRAEGIGKIYANGFVGLQPVSVEIPHFQIVALMGPSGCGKSTLLKALNGDNPATSGDVFIHGLSLRENYNLLKRKIGYVPQDDIIHRELTVVNTLYLAAKLRLPDGTSEEEIQSRITEVLASLNIDEFLHHKKVEKLSGGQRKRVCIAVELLSRPTILFLDEPTSPLDPETIKEFLERLVRLAKNGTTIVMVTHKPEDLYYVDKAIFMAAKGYLVYYGDKDGLSNKDKLIEKFKVDNIIKVYNKFGNDFNVDEFYIKPKKQIIQRDAEKNLVIDKQNSLLGQFYWLTKRYLEIKLSDRNNIFLLLAQPIIIAGLISFVFHEVNISVMMLIAISAIWFGVSNSSKEIVSEFPIYKRERMFNLNIHMYILSKWAVLSLVSLVQVIVFVGIIHLKFGGDGILASYAHNTAFMFCIASSATLFGLFLSAYFDTTEKVLTVVPIALMPQIMLAGVVEIIHSLKVDMLSFLMLGRWGTEGFLRIQNEPILYPKTPFPALDMLYYNDSLKKNGDGIIQLFNGIDANVFAILFLGGIMYVLTYVSLKKKDSI